MVTDVPARFDEDGRELDEDSGKNKCWCSGESIKIFVPSITVGILIPPAPERYNYQPDLNHCAVFFYGWMLSDDDPDRHEAFKGNLIVRIQKFEDNGDATSDQDEYYVGLPADFQGVPAITKTLVRDMNGIPQGLVKVASQELGHCPKCKKRAEVTVWAEAMGPTGNIDWEDIRRTSEYMVERREEQGEDASTDQSTDEGED